MFLKTCVIIIFIQCVHPCKESCYKDTTPMKLLIDTDAGGDDAVAISLILANKNVQIVAITCVYGNTVEANVERNVLKILTIANRTDIPVYGGSIKPLKKKYIPTNLFGNDGFGDFRFDKKIIGTIDRSKRAPNAIVNLSKIHAGSLNILTLGPLTNIALAISLDSNFTQRVKKFYVMGSMINESPESEKHPEIEFNFGLDPESNAIFLNSLTNTRKALVFPWDVALKVKIEKEWRMNVLGKLKSEVIHYLNKIENIILNKTNQWYAADTITAAILLWPSIATASKKATMFSTTSGPFNGSVTINTNPAYAKKFNVDIVRNFNPPAYKDKLLQCFC